MARAEIDITIDCLDILRLRLPRLLALTPPLDYAAESSVFHLDEIDKPKVTSKDKQRIQEELHWLFHNNVWLKDIDPERSLDVWSKTIQGLREYGVAKEANWEKYFRATTLEVNYISDGPNPTGMFELGDEGSMLLRAGDGLHAAAILSIMSDISEEYHYDCDGPCDTSCDEWDEMHLCEICENAVWCGECIQLLKTDRLVKRECNSDHTFYRVSPLRKEAREFADERIVAEWCREESVVLRKHWTGGLREEWSKWRARSATGSQGPMLSTRRSSV
ncbi:hypothetical protein LTR60_000456 [Cryomyces antarcticus]|nr:hypothetical protein LTR39_000689 [Cryomyces antarcticus]KAK5020504.1 hypothetical protein LTR60_000456 [Cryomyces antarcticus]